MAPTNNTNPKSTAETKSKTLDIPTEAQLKQYIIDENFENLKKTTSEVGKSDYTPNLKKSITNIDTKNNLTPKPPVEAKNIPSKQTKSQNTDNAQIPLQNPYDKTATVATPVDATIVEADKTFIEKAWEWISNNKLLSGIWAAVAWWGILKRLKKDKKKKWESDEPMSWWKKALIWGAGIFGVKLAWDNKDDILDYFDTRDIIIKKVIDKAPVSTQDFLKKVCETHKKELSECNLSDIPTKIMEFAVEDAKNIPWQKMEEVKNSSLEYIKSILPVWATDFLGKSEEEAKKMTEEEKEKHHNETNTQTEKVNTIMLWDKTEKPDIKTIDSTWKSIAKDWNDNKNSDREINKNRINDIYNNATTFVQAFANMKNEKWNLLYPNLTNGIVNQFVDMMDFMKDKKEYLSVANGFKIIMNINNKNISPMITREWFLIQMDNKDQIEKALDTCKSIEDIDKYMVWLYKSKDISDRYNKEAKKWIETIWVEIKNMDDGKNWLINQNSITKLKDLGADMYGHGTLTVSDFWADDYGSTFAGISWALIAWGTAATATWVWSIWWVPAMLIWWAVGALSTWAINTSLWQDYNMREWAWDFMMNMIPWWAFAKLWKSAAKLAVWSSRLAMALEIWSTGLAAWGLGIWVWYIKTGEIKFGSNVWISMALAALPFGFGKLWSKIKSVKLPTSIANFGNDVLSKYTNSSNSIILLMRKASLRIALRGKNWLSSDTKDMIANDVNKLSKDMQNDIGQYIYSLEQKLMQKEADEIKEFLKQAGIKKIEYTKNGVQALKKWSKINRQLSIPNISNINKILLDKKIWSNKDIDSINNFIKSTDDYIVTIKWEKYRPQIDKKTREIIFEDISKWWWSYIDSKWELYKKLIANSNTYITWKISNAFIKRIEQEKNNNWWKQLISEFFARNNYKLTPKVSLWLAKNKQATINSLLEYFNLDFQNCRNKSDYGTKWGKILWATTKASIFSAPVSLVTSCLINDWDWDRKYNLTEWWIATLFWWRKLRLLVNIIDAIDPVDYIREKTWI